MACAHGSPCPPPLPGRMSWPHGALLFLWLFSPPLGAGGGGVALTSAAGGGSPPATSCPAACSCSNQASRVICTRRELAEVPASIPVNTRYLNLQENGIQVSGASSLQWGLGGTGDAHRQCHPPPCAGEGLWASRQLHALPLGTQETGFAPSNWSLGSCVLWGTRLRASVPVFGGPTCRPPKAGVRSC